MGITLTLPTPGDHANNGLWGPVINTALQALSDCDQFKYKTADESVTSNATVQDDDHLVSLSLAVGTHLVEAAYLVSGAAAGDFKVAWSFSGTTTLAVRGGGGPSAAVSSVLTGAGAGQRTAAAADTAGTITGGAIYAVDGTNWSWIFETGVLVVSAAGSLKVQWAQGTSSGTATILRAGSYLRARQVA